MLSVKSWFFGPPVVAGRVLWIRVCPPFCHILLSGSFPGIGSSVFSETRHSVKDLCVVVHERARFFEKNLAQKMGKMCKKLGFKFKLYLENKRRKNPAFLHFDADSWKVEVDWKILGWACSKIDVATLFSTSKIGSMSRENEWDKLIFGVLIQIQES